MHGAGEQSRGAGWARAVFWVAWSLWALSVALFTGGQLFDYLTPPTYPGEDGLILLDALFWALSLTYVTVGALVASRRPENPIGWIFLGTGLIANSFGPFAQYYALYGLGVRDGSLPGEEYTAWLSDWIVLPIVALATVLLLLLFPAGRLPSRGWRIVVWMAVLGSVMITFGDALATRALDAVSYVENPVGIGGVAGDLAVALDRIGIYLSLTTVCLAAASLIVRLVRARGEERQQLKWFTFATAMLIGGFSAAFLFSFSYRINEIGWFLGFLGYFFFPVAVGIAILRYHLYDIDVIVNRTLVYVTLTVTLSLVYLGSVAGLQRLLAPLAGDSNQLATVASTLFIVALFSPLRRRVQAFIDRRFYRRKYDAVRTLESFSVKLRDATDLDALGSGLVAVLRETMQPEYVSLWLRPREDRAAR